MVFKSAKHLQQVDFWIDGFSPECTLGWSRAVLLLSTTRAKAAQGKVTVEYGRLRHYAGGKVCTVVPDPA